jgi:phosphatidyl-myo-inositol dimannoside synthase
VRTLLVTRNFPPLVGGMERLNQHICESLARHGEVALVGPRGCTAFVPRAVRVFEVPHRPLPRFIAGAFAGAWRMAKSFAPDRILAGSGLAAPQARLAARRARAPYAVYVHGLDVVVAHPVYQRLWLPAIRAADRILVNSRNTAALAQARGVPRDRIHIVTPGTEIFDAPAPLRAEERASLGLGDGPVLLSVGRLTERKGLAEFVRDALPALVAARPGLQLVVIGSDANDAVAAARISGRARILAEAERAGVARHVQLRGVVEDVTLDALYRHADAHIVPVRDLPGDVEGFGMVALEAAARGVPTLGYAVGGVPDAVEHGVTGALVAPDDAHALSNVTLAWLDRPRAEVRDACRAFAARNDWATFERRFLEALP